MDGTEPAPGGAPLTSPLHDRHVALGAKFADFGGWSMPLEYPSGVVKEHTAVRESVGIFDVSHLGKVTVSGPGAAAFVNATLTNDLGRIRHGKAQYTLCCDDATGGIVDDLIVYLHTDDRVLLVPNAANTSEVARRLAEAAPDGITVNNRHRDYVVLSCMLDRYADSGLFAGAIWAHDIDFWHNTVPGEAEGAFALDIDTYRARFAGTGVSA